jgi:branched-chain amino acid transport system ATP-binding protein
MRVLPGNNDQIPLLAIEQLSVFYDQFRAIKDINLSVAAGEVVSIIGANGAGKSSLLKAIIAQADRVEGTIRYEGEDLAGRTTAEIVAKGIALVPEGRRLFPSLSVEENLYLGWEVGRRGEIGFDQVFALFPTLRECLRQKARELSGGQQQMVALGRALLTNPTLLLCDEISLGLAPLMIDQMYKLIPAIKQRGIGILVVEQDITRSLSVADRFYCLLEGEVTLEGRPADTTRDIVMQHYFGL